MSETSTTPDFTEAILGAMSARLLDVHTMLPGEVQSFDAEKNTVDVKPQVKTFWRNEGGDLELESIPVIQGVPVCFPGAGGFRATFPIAKGDTCLLVFSEASLDVWRSKGGDVDPADFRRHHLSDAVAIFSLKPNSSPWNGVSTDAATFGKDGGPQAVFRAAVIELGGNKDSTTAKFVALENLVKQELQKLQAKLAALTTAYNAHIHTVSTAGPPLAHTGIAAKTLVTAQAPDSVGDVGATKVKAI